MQRVRVKSCHLSVRFVFLFVFLMSSVTTKKTTKTEALNHKDTSFFVQTPNWAKSFTSAVAGLQAPDKRQHADTIKWDGERGFLKIPAPVNHLFTDTRAQRDGRKTLENRLGVERACLPGDHGSPISSELALICSSHHQSSLWRAALLFTGPDRLQTNTHTQYVAWTRKLPRLEEEQWDTCANTNAYGDQNNRRIKYAWIWLHGRWDSMTHAQFNGQTATTNLLQIPKHRTWYLNMRFSAATAAGEKHARTHTAWHKHTHSLGCVSNSLT